MSGQPGLFHELNVVCLIIVANMYISNLDKLKHGNMFGIPKALVLDISLFGIRHGMCHLKMINISKGCITLGKMSTAILPRVLLGKISPQTDDTYYEA